MNLRFDAVNSPALSPEDKELIISRPQNRIGKGAVLRVISQQTPSQAENRQLAMERCIMHCNEVNNAYDLIDRMVNLRAPF